MDIIKLGHAILESLPMIFIGIGIVLGFYGLSNIRAIAIWIKGGVEDGDGTLENKELQIAFFSLLSAFEVIAIAFMEIDFPDTVIYCTFGLAGLAYTANRGTDAWSKKLNSTSSTKKEDYSKTQKSDDEDDGTYV